MRRALFVVLAAGALLAGLVGIASPAGALGPVDLGASVAATPTAVSPAGGLVHYTVTFVNDGLVPATATLTDATDNGTLADVNGVGPSDACAVPAVGTSDPTITCTVTLAAGASKTIEVVIATPTTAPAQVTNTATAELAPRQLDLVDVNVANDQAVVTTAVTDPTPTTGASAFVPEGGTLSYKTHTLTVVDAYNEGVVPTMADAIVAPGTMCGPNPCKTEGLHVEFDEDERFAGLTEVDVNFSQDDPCFGLGNATCYSLWFRKLSTDLPEPLLACGQEEENDPCLLRAYKDGRGFHQVVKMETDDPDLMQTVKSLGSGTNR
ncbi:MAG TPA: hypothetical protein VF230_02935 [Acidimicrobiales bacterium]